MEAAEISAAFLYAEFALDFVGMQTVGVSDE